MVSSSYISVNSIFFFVIAFLNAASSISRRSKGEIRDHSKCVSKHPFCNLPNVQSFYVKPNLREVRPPADNSPNIDVASIIEQLRRSHELAASLAELVSKKPC